MCSRNIHLAFAERIEERIDAFAERIEERIDAFVERIEAFEERLRRE